MRYLTIPGTAFAAFLFLGFLEIGQEMFVTSLNNGLFFANPTFLARIPSTTTLMTLVSLFSLVNSLNSFNDGNTRP